jgi:hypothetical protein
VVTEGAREDCGTLKGVFIHARLGERRCAACREFHRVKEAEYRSRPENKRSKRAKSRAERRTFARLRRLFPAEYLEIQAEEMARSYEEEEES